MKKVIKRQKTFTIKGNNCFQFFSGTIDPYGTKITVVVRTNKWADENVEIQIKEINVDEPKKGFDTSLDIDSFIELVKEESFK